MNKRNYLIKAKNYEEIKIKKLIFRKIKIKILRKKGVIIS